ncbi:MAG: hypothetical protein ACRDJL_10540 [Actinomycetota bacterium]
MPFERALARESRRSFGILALNQLLGLGLTPAQVKGACRAGARDRVLPRVYRVTSVPECWEQRPHGRNSMGRTHQRRLRRNGGFSAPADVSPAGVLARHL